MAKRIFTYLVIAIAMTTLFGCGTPTPAPVQGTTPETKPTNTTAAAAPAPVVMLDYYELGNGDTTVRPAVEKAINDYVQPLINANVTFHIVTGADWQGKAVTALEAGEKIDIFFTADWNGYPKEVSEGLLTKLNDPTGPNGDLIAQYGQAITSSINPAYITGSQINGVNYAIPTNKELSVPWGFVYNATIADEIGMTDADAALIKTPADMEPWLAKAKVKHPDMAVYLTDGTVGFMQWVHGFTSVPDLVLSQSALPMKDGVLDLKNGVVDEKVISPMSTPWMADYLKTMRAWYNKGYIPQDAGLTTFDPAQNFNAGNFFIEPQPLKGNNIKATELMIASGNPDLKLKEIYGMPKVVNTSDAGGSMLGIPKSSPDPVTAMKFINLMHSDSTLINMMVFGVPDTMWKVDPDGRVNVIDSSWQKAIAGPWTMGDITLQKVTNKEDPDKAAKLIDYAKDAFFEPSLGFRFDSNPVAAQIAAVQTVYDGGGRALMTGYVDPTTELPKYIQDLKNAGLDAVIAEVQKQYDAWKVAKGG